MRFKSWEFYKTFLQYYLPITIVFISIVIVFYFLANKADLAEFKAQQLIYIEAHDEIIRHDMHNITADLMMLADYLLLHDLCVDLSDHDWQQVEQGFLVFIRNKKLFDQLRFISANGMELIRVNWNDGEPVIVPHQQLQNKSERYYFKQTIHLNKREIFVSPMDLNIEHGKVETPIKPMMRFAMPVINKKGEKCGMVILNYLADNLLQDLKLLDDMMDGNILMLNHESFYLLGAKAEDEWGFMFPGMEDKNFSRHYPQAWQEISTRKSGQFTTSQGLFSFASPNPLLECLLTGSTSPESVKEIKECEKTKNYTWKLISHVPPHVLNKNLHTNRMMYLVINILMLILIGAGCWLTVDARLKRREAELELQRQATHDALTGLPNRNFFYDQLEKT